MIYKILADAVVFVHLMWIVFLIAGAFWGVKHKAMRILHLSGIGYAFAIQIFGWYCPLTHVEIWLRMRHDPSLSYKGSFIVHYAEKLIYLQIPGRMIFVLTVALAGFNAWVYLRYKKG